MENLREEIKDIVTPDGLPDGEVCQEWIRDITTELLELFRSWTDDILVELRHIRANAPLNEKTRTRERLRKLIEKIEGATNENNMP